MARKILSGILLDEHSQLSLAELCRACDLHADALLEMVEEGLLEPAGRDPARWRFPATALPQVRMALRLQRDLGVNTAGAALAVELLEEVERLRMRLEVLERTLFEDER